MWVQSYSNIYKDISIQKVWNLWADINNYLSWHDDLDYCRLEGPFTVGNYFTLKPKGGPVFKIYITELLENNNGKYKRFTDCTKFFGAKMYDIHELEETEEGIRISNTIKVTGWLSYLWVHLVAKHVAKSSSKEMAALVKLTRNEHE